MRDKSLTKPVFDNVFDASSVLLVFCWLRVEEIKEREETKDYSWMPYVESVLNHVERTDGRQQQLVFLPRGTILEESHYVRTVIIATYV